MSITTVTQTHRYSVSIVTQGRHKFYTFTMPSDVLANTCYVSTRDEDPIKGFQRVLDEDRAQSIADYIDSGLGTIPTSIVLSAQPEADFHLVGKGKTIEFKAIRKAFLIIDGQHRVFGFSKAKTRLRIPVVVYSGLTRTEEAKLFIDINTKQRPVSNELLLDIKKLAEYESSMEQLFSSLFDLFNSDSESPLLGLMSPTERVAGRISRVTFNAAMKPILSSFEGAEPEKVYAVLKEYVRVCVLGCDNLDAHGVITNPTVFRGFMLLFPDVAQRVQDRYGAKFTADNFETVMKGVFAKTKASTFLKPGRSHKDLYEVLVKSLRQQFTLGLAK
jgi:DGQHR domain-containing protein